MMKTLLSLLLLAFPISTGQYFHLTWQHDGGEGVSYRLYVADGNGGWKFYQEFPTTEAFVTIKSPTQFCVTATNAVWGIETDASNTVKVGLAAPTKLEATIAAPPMKAAK